MKMEKEHFINELVRRGVTEKEAKGRYRITVDLLKKMPFDTSPLSMRGRTQDEFFDKMAKALKTKKGQ
jgi:hypothetical protein